MREKRGRGKGAREKPKRKLGVRDYNLLRSNQILNQKFISFFFFSELQAIYYL